MQSQERLAPGRVIERYVVEEKLGSGGMASVWRLRHRQLGTFHALKVLSNMGAHAEVRLMLEGRVQAALRHPNIVAVTDILDVAGSPGLLMEYVPPPSLAVWRQENDASVAEAEALFRGIVEGVGHAHRFGLVHRDLKPANVLLARGEDGRLVPKVADFGLAKLISEDPAAGHTRSGLVMGTPQYMAPEQIRDAKKVDRRADLFSLGCILYELLTGRPPFPWTDFITLFTDMQARAYPPLPAHVPARLVDATHRLLDPDRETRLPDCETLVAVLDGRAAPAPRPAALSAPLPPLAERSRPGLSGETFVDDTTLAPIADLPGIPPAPRRAPAPPARAPWPLRPLLLSMGALALLGGGGLVAGVGWGMWRAHEGRPLAPVSAAGRPASGSPREASPPAPVAVPATTSPPSPGEAAAAPEGTPVSEPQGVAGAPEAPAAGRGVNAAASPAPAGSPRPIGEAPPSNAVLPPTLPAVSPALPPPAAPVPAAAHVALTGDSDASRVELVDAAGRHALPADVPAGTYDVYAWFPDSPQTKTARLTVAVGESVSLRCLAFSMSCKRP